MCNIDPETVDRLKSTALDRLLTPKKQYSSEDLFSKSYTFSPKVGRPKSAKGQERLKTPFHQRL